MPGTAFCGFAVLRRALVLGVMLALASPAMAATSPAPAQAAYCVAVGGAVQTRRPTYGTNGGTPLILSGSRDFCQFVSRSDGSSINVLLETLATPAPTLATLAYYAQTPFDSSTCKGSPGSCYCSQLGGTDLFGGISAAGGGWVLASNPADVLDACIFPDLSSIDSYGLYYHSAAIVRGRDLTHILRYHDPY